MIIFKKSRVKNKKRIMYKKIIYFVIVDNNDELKNIL